MSKVFSPRFRGPKTTVSHYAGNGAHTPTQHNWVRLSPNSRSLRKVDFCAECRAKRITTTYPGGY